MKKDNLYTILWFIIPVSILVLLFDQEFRMRFVDLNHSHPMLLGFFKFFILATLGEILGRRLAYKKWQVRQIQILERAFVWGCFGFVFSYIFPLFSGGVDELNRIGLLFTFQTGILKIISLAFWKSFFINMIFAFPFMTLHKITDSLIDQKLLFKKWPFISIWKNLDWDTQWNKVAPTILWFWVPAHTITFSLPTEYRVLLAAYLGIVLGIVLAFFNAKKI
jgi:hypothetical protein